jgi:hypothetical protein
VILAHLHFQKGLIKDAYQTASGSIFVKEEDLTWKDDLISLQREKIKHLEEDVETLSGLLKSK